MVLGSSPSGPTRKLIKIKELKYITNPNQKLSCTEQNSNETLVNKDFARYNRFIPSEISVFYIDFAGYSRFITSGMWNIMQKIIGRKSEIQILKKMLSSNDAEFLALYGRRRVGKTYLIRTFFRDSSCIFFEATGQKDGTMKEQLLNFAESISKTFFQGLNVQSPENWKDAFKSLTVLIKKMDKDKKVVLFFDELPWMVTPRSQFMQHLDYIWNTEWSDLGNLKLIVCGSAASWMLEHFIHTKGGLHNRITGRICLKPFNLEETRQYLKYREISLNHQQVLELYMVMGGIPHYLKSVSKGLSAVQNINNICFTKDGLLFDEFQKLYASLYKDSGVHIKLIRLIASSRQGISLNEIIEKDKNLSSGGTLRRRLLELEAAGFIHGMVPYGNKKKGIFYRILDEYTYFYLKWIEPISQSVDLLGEASYWGKISHTPNWYNWTGYVFESVCFKHVDKIRRALGIDKIISKVGSWRYVSGLSDEGKGAQIDLLFDRADRVVTICEIKSGFGKFSINKAYAENLRNKIAVYKNQINTKKQIFIAMITTHGLDKNEYSEELVSNEITLKDLFGEN